MIAGQMTRPATAALWRNLVWSMVEGVVVVVGDGDGEGGFSGVAVAIVRGANAAVDRKEVEFQLQERGGYGSRGASCCAQRSESGLVVVILIKKYLYLRQAEAIDAGPLTSRRRA